MKTIHQTQYTSRIDPDEWEAGEYKRDDRYSFDWKAVIAIIATAIIIFEWIV